MKIDRCPPECTFDWARFHQRLDIAAAHMIDETEQLPSKTTLVRFLQYSNAKQRAQINDPRKESH